jgi:hypothetical protein
MDRSIADKPITALSVFLALSVAGPASADVYSYMNEDGDYVVSKQRPQAAGEYAVLTDDGKFIELVRPPTLRVPITHWRPWYLPREPNPLDPIEPDTLPEPKVIIEEVDQADGQRRSE